LAGPVVAAAVILPPDFDLPELYDSKRLTPAGRRHCEGVIRSTCVSVAVSWVSPRRIDRLNILNATLWAQRRALELLPVRPWTILVDGNRSPVLPRSWRSRLRAVVGGDRSSVSIAAASVVAKSTRDRRMQRLERRYPGYGFARHKGYATSAHRDAVRRLGLSPVHRRTFCGWLHEEAELARQMQLPWSPKPFLTMEPELQRRGRIGEGLAAHFLELEGCRVLQRNVRCADVEVDLVARHDRVLLLVEVKLRGRTWAAAGQAVRWPQRQRLVRAAQALLLRHPWAQSVRIDVVAIDWRTAAGELCLRHLRGVFSD
jgi:ribonuclease HII